MELNMLKRRQTIQVAVGKGIKQKCIGSDHPILVQAMTTTQTSDVWETMNQIMPLENAGCEMIRVAVQTPEDARAIREITRHLTIPLVADIHFNPQLALLAIEYGADKIRWNPGNITKTEMIKDIAQAAKDVKIPMRIGVNGGSLRKDLLDNPEFRTSSGGYKTAGMMVRECLDAVALIEDIVGGKGIVPLVLSVKASDPLAMLTANFDIARQTDYPIHLGVTEAGSDEDGIIVSCAGLMPLLAYGIGDTIRVSIKDPLKQIRAAYRILRSYGLREYGVRIISCPTCGRMGNFPLTELEQRLNEEFSKRLDLRGTIALMGCPVNGIGESNQHSYGLIGSHTGAADIYYNGNKEKRIEPPDIIDKIVVDALEFLEGKS